MKNWFSKIVYTLLIGGILWFSWGFFFPSEINKICKRLNSLAACLSFSSSGSYVMRMAAADSVRDFFSTNIVVNLDGVHARAEYISGRAEVMSILTTARTYLKELNVKFEDPQVEIDESKTHAVMEVLTRITLDENRRDKIYQLIRMNWIKEGDKWRVERVDTLKMLGRENI